MTKIKKGKIEHTHTQEIYSGLNLHSVFLENHM